MLDYNPSHEQNRIGVYNNEAYYEIEGYYFVRETSGEDRVDTLIHVRTLPVSLAVA